MIYDLCSGSGAWSLPYREAGYDVRQIDLPLDVRLLRRPAEAVHGVLAAPPCTVFSYARNRYPPSDKELRRALSVVDACLRFIIATKPAWWALENPRNKLRRYLGEPRLVFYQWEYGDPAHKPTGIWGRFVAPPKRPRQRRKLPTFKTSQENALPGDAVTPPRFARAFFEANP